jgi:hypothetical protein
MEPLDAPHESRQPPLRPEQKAARVYARRRGTEAPVAAIAERLRRTFGELDALLDTVPEDLAARSPAPGSWSVREVVDHLVVSHRRAAAQLRELLAGRAPADGPIPAGLQSPAPEATPWSELAAELGQVHGDFLGAVEGASDRTPLDTRAPVVMVVKCARPDGSLEPVHWVESFDWKAFAILFRMHAHEHLGQIRRALASFDAAASMPIEG